MEQPLMRAHPERTAWIVLWAAFIIFCVLLVATPLSIRYVLYYSTVARPATLEVLEGTARVTNPSSGRLDAYTKVDGPVSVGEGIVIQLDDKASADLRFSDGSYVHILSDSDLTIERLRVPRFGRGVTPVTVWLRMSQGRLRLVTSRSTRAVAPEYVLRLPELAAEISLQDDGLYGAEVEPQGGEIWAHRGSAVVTANGRSVRLLALERTTLAPGEQPALPIASARNWVLNGDFAGSDNWRFYDDPGADAPGVDGTVTLTTDGSTQAVRLYRSGSNGNHGETGLEQTFSRPLPDPVSSLMVQARLKVVSQSLPGGGSLASEYPLIIRLRYRDEYGSENEWVHGFYIGDPRGNPTTNGTQVPAGEWYLFESGNLLADGNPFGQLAPKPVRIVWLKVYASGWDYESLVGSISLEVQ